MQMKKTFLKNASYVFLANTICILVNVAVNFLVPVLFSQESYSYYQLENLYCGYIWILTLGWHEGIYIYYGGKSEDIIDKKEISTQCWMFFLYLIFVSTISIGIGGLYFKDIAKKYVFGMSMASVAIEAVRYVYLYYLICVDEMKRYTKYMVGDRFVYIAFVFLLLVFNLTDYRFLIGADILSKAFLLGCILCINRSLFFRKIAIIRESLNHAKRMIKSGINVTFASFVSRFINGTVRLAIEASWGILVFGKISLTLSVSNMFTQFIQAVSVVLFPALRRTTEENRRTIYVIISDLLDVFMFCLFVLYLPGVKILNFILPQYEDGLRYMAILLPVCLFDARNIILNNTYLKALHQERGILISNLVAVFFSVSFTGVTVYVLHDLNMAVLSMVFLVAIRCICSEWILKKKLCQESMRNIVEEGVMTFVFIMANWYVSGIGGTLIYVSALILYFAVNRRRVADAVRYVMRKEDV